MIVSAEGKRMEQKSCLEGKLKRAYRRRFLKVGSVNVDWGVLAGEQGWEAMRRII